MPTFTIEAKETVTYEATIEADDEKAALKAARAVQGTSQDLDYTSKETSDRKIVGAKQAAVPVQSYVNGA